MAEPLPVDATLREWLRVHRVELSWSYEQTARGLVEHHLVPFLGARDWRTLCRSDASAFAEWMLGRGLSASTIQNALSVLRRVANVLIEGERLESNCFANPGRLLRGIRRRSEREVDRADAFTLVELTALIDAARLPRFAWFSPLLVFLVSTGARRGEAIALRWGDVDFERGVVAIRRSRVRGREGLTKSGRSREVPLAAASPVLRHMLEEIIRERRPNSVDPIFLSPKGRPLDERNISRCWYLLRRRAGVRPLRLHDLRHTFASHAIDRGISIPRVSAWLGHAQIETTLRVYTHCIPLEREPLGFLSIGSASR